MIILQASILAHDNKRNELMGACRLITDQTRNVKDCEKSNVYQDHANENIITVEQHWKQWPSMKNYFLSDHFTALLGAMKWLGMSYEIRIIGGTPNEGMDAFKRARNRRRK